jgi:hypothetical protein
MILCLAGIPIKNKSLNCNAQVTTLQAEIIKLQPTLLRAGQETAELIETVR